MGSTKGTNKGDLSDNGGMYSPPGHATVTVCMCIDTVYYYKYIFA